MAALIGSITLIPGFVAFPLAAALLQNGAGYMQISAFSCHHYIFIDIVGIGLIVWLTEKLLSQQEKDNIYEMAVKR